MRPELLDEIRDLPAEDRLAVARAALESLTQDRAPLSADFVRELERVHDDYLADGDAGSDWESVKARIRART